MKKKLCIVLVMCMLGASFAGCSKKKEENPDKKQEVTQAPVATEEVKEEEEEPLSYYYTFADDNKKNLGALYCVGRNDSEKETQLPEFLKKNNLEESDFDTVIDTPDSEWYVIIPKYAGTTIKIEQVSLDDNGKFKVDSELATTEKPVLLSCNPSDIVPSVLVTMTYKDQTLEFNPSLSLEDGSICKIEGMYSE